MIKANYAKERIASTMAEQVSGAVIVSGAIEPVLTLQASPSVVQPKEEFILSGRLRITKRFGDIDDDGHVSYRDLFTLAASYGKRSTEAGYNPDADLNDDGVVDYRDLLTLAAAYGQRADGKPIEIQQYDGERWLTIASVLTGTGGNFEVILSAPEVTGTYYFRAYFPGGEY